MIREIIIPKDINFTLKIPKEYINKKIEILILPFFKEEKIKKSKTLDIFSKTAGILKSKNIDPIKWQMETRSDREI
ncbi:MAG: hypothetical protein WC141_09060 [Arcobacteraceae bacterium]